MYTDTCDNFGIIHRHSDFLGESSDRSHSVNVQKDFLVIKEGLSYGYVTRSRMIIHDLLLFLDARGIHAPDQIGVQDNDEFVKSLCRLSPKGIEAKLCTLRRNYRYLYLQEYIIIPLSERLPKVSIQGMVFELIKKLCHGYAGILSWITYWRHQKPKVAGY